MTLTVGVSLKQFSHDIKSPLTALECIVAEMTGLDDDSKTIALAACKRIFSLADKVLMAQKNETIMRPHNLLENLEELIKLKQAEYKYTKNTEIFIEASPNTHDLICLIDKVEFERAISNLINNAIEACQNPAKVIVKIEKDGNNATISIIDNGVGISDIITKKLLKGERVSTKNSSALGFTHARNFAVEHGGAIGVVSSSFVGTTITLSLPIHFY